MVPIETTERERENVAKRIWWSDLVWIFIKQKHTEHNILYIFRCVFVCSGNLSFNWLCGSFKVSSRVIKSERELEKQLQIKGNETKTKTKKESLTINDTKYEGER